jgi:hypothetical protein
MLINPSTLNNVTIILISTGFVVIGFMLGIIIRLFRNRPPSEKQIRKIIEET